MSETVGVIRKDRASKVRRKREQESVLRPTFAALRQQPASGRTAEPGLQTSHMFERSERRLQNQSAASIESVQNRGCPNWRCGYDFSRVPARNAKTQGKHNIQASLTVNPPGDTYEQEADRVAEDVMRAPQSTIQLTPTWLDEGEPSGEGDVGSSVGSVSSISRVQASRESDGQTLPKTERTFFETRMGYDFSRVHVHTDANAVQASRTLKARAFTSGQHIAFNHGAYQSATAAGQRLLAHELTHLAQQGAAGKPAQIKPSPVHPGQEGETR